MLPTEWNTRELVVARYDCRLPLEIFFKGKKQYAIRQNVFDRIPSADPRRKFAFPRSNEA